MIWWLLLGSVLGSLAMFFLGRRFIPTGMPTDASRAIKAAADKAIETASNKAKEALDASDDDLSRRINELREKGRESDK